MADKPTLIVVAKQKNPEFSMLNGVPYVLASDPAAGNIAADMQAILFWSGNREMLREAFLKCSRLRWVHSRWAGLDALLFSGPVNSDTNGKGCSRCPTMDARGNKNVLFVLKRKTRIQSGGCSGEILLKAFLADYGLSGTNRLAQQIGTEKLLVYRKVLHYPRVVLYTN